MRHIPYCLLLSVAATALALVSCGSDVSPAPVQTTEIAYSSLPLAAEELPPGPGREETLIACMSCHSPAYITSQPRLSRAVWESEVKKMIDTYGAQVRPYDQKLIVDYLVAIRGLAQKER